MKSHIFLISGIILISFLLIFGCSNDLKNPTEPEKNQSNAPETLLKNENQVTSSRAEAVISSVGQQNIYNFIGVFFNGIYDRTQLGGFPSMQFKAYSKALDQFGVNPYFLNEIYVEAKVWLQMLGSSSWIKLWEANDKKTDWWHSSVQSQVFSKKQPWTAKSQSKHEWYDGVNPKYGMLTNPIEYTAYFIERKAPK